MANLRKLAMNNLRAAIGMLQLATAEGDKAAINLLDSAGTIIEQQSAPTNGAVQETKAPVKAN